MQEGISEIFSTCEWVSPGFMWNCYTCDTLPMAGGAKQAELQVHFDDKKQKYTR